MRVYQFRHVGIFNASAKPNNFLLKEISYYSVLPDFVNSLAEVVKKKHHVAVRMSQYFFPPLTPMRI